MFRSTLTISRRVITITHTSNEGMFEADKHGRYDHFGNAVNEEIKNNIRSYIQSFSSI